ncbi:MAG: SAM-dependent methyltransferase, partial [Acinetobacter sp.]
MNIQEVASPIDLKDPEEALLWANEANIKRPWRYEFF